jgi:hypothetical protein
MLLLKLNSWLNAPLTWNLQVPLAVGNESKTLPCVLHTASTTVELWLRFVSLCPHARLISNKVEGKSWRHFRYCVCVWVICSSDVRRWQVCQEHNVLQIGTLYTDMCTKWSLLYYLVVLDRKHVLWRKHACHEMSVLLMIVTGFMIRIRLEKKRPAQRIWKFPKPLMGNEGSLPCSQEPTPGPYPESVESNRHPHIPLISDPF